MKNNSNSGINLVKLRVSFVDKFINWVLSFGRVVVIITEVVALSAFLYRFTLDRQLIDIHSKIKQEQAIVSYSKVSEDKYRNLQDRIQISSQFSKLGENQVKTLKDIISLAPSGVSFDNLTISEDRIKINASVNIVSQLGVFIDSLKGYPAISSVSIDKIENQATNSLITVGITGSLKKNKNPYDTLR